MCLIGFALQVHPLYPLVLAANRDEFHARATRTAHWWQDEHGNRVFGGRDLEAGGSWLLLGGRGRLVALTNYREPNGSVAPRSRGELVTLLAASPAPLPEAMQALSPALADFAGFSLLAFDWSAIGEVATLPRAWLLTNRGPQAAHGPVGLGKGVQALSNGPLDAPWPKSVRLREELQTWCGDGLQDTAPLLAALGHAAVPPADDLPDTGVGTTMERLLGSAFIRSDPARGYGTRSSAIMRLDSRGVVRFDEWTWDASSTAPVWTYRRQLQTRLPES